MWTTSHPAVALWVKERQAGYVLSGFATLDQWGKRAEISTPPYAASETRRFALSADTFDELGFDQLAARVVDHLSEPGAVARLWGASGIGKTRALHQALSASAGELRELTAANFIFCDYPEVSGEIWNVLIIVVVGLAILARIYGRRPTSDQEVGPALSRRPGRSRRVLRDVRSGAEPGEVVSPDRRPRRLFS